MHAKYEVSVSYGSKVIVNVIVENKQTDKAITICPRSFDPRHKKCFYIENHRMSTTNVVSIHFSQCRLFMLIMGHKKIQLETTKSLSATVLE